MAKLEELNNKKMEIERWMFYVGFALAYAILRGIIFLFEQIFSSTGSSDPSNNKFAEFKRKKNQRKY